MGNKIDREVRNQWETKKGMKKTINQQSHIISKQSRRSMLQYMRHGIKYKKESIHLFLHARTFCRPLGIFILCGSSGN